MLCDVLQYLRHSGFGLLVLMKSTGSVVWGFGDILNVSYSTIPGDEEATSRRLGLIYSCLGIGCLVGPGMANMFTDPERPATFQFACVTAVAVMMMGWFGIGNAPNFGTICAFTALKTIGTSTIWVNSSLILQRLTQPQRMGRVMAFEFASAMFFDAVSATLAGYLLDHGAMPDHIALGASALAGFLFFLWSIYHMFGKGAARSELNRRSFATDPTRSADLAFA